MLSSKELTSRCLRLSSSYLIRRSKDQQASARPLVRLTVDQKVLPGAFALDLFGFGVSPCPSGAAGAMSFHDPLEGTETSQQHGARSRLLAPFGSAVFHHAARACCVDALYRPRGHLARLQNPCPRCGPSRVSASGQYAGCVGIAPGV